MMELDGAAMAEFCLVWRSLGKVPITEVTIDERDHGGTRRTSVSCSFATIAGFSNANGVFQPRPR
jgi:hypothetical protein